LKFWSQFSIMIFIRL